MNNKIILFPLIFIISINLLNSQNLDSIFNSIEENHQTSLKEIDKIFDFYSDDFNLWKNKVDLTKVNLIPENAVINDYELIISNREKVINEVVKYIGIPYIWGGSNPTGFDCSGLIQWTIKKTHDVLIPRTTKLQSQKWKKQLNYDLNQIEPGDLIYFNGIDNSISHVGIFLSKNSFIHAPNRKELVKKSIMSSYWLKRFAGFINLNLVVNPST